MLIIKNPKIHNSCPIVMKLGQNYYLSSCTYIFRFKINLAHDLKYPFLDIEITNNYSFQIGGMFLQSEQPYINQDNTDEDIEEQCS